LISIKKHCADGEALGVGLWGERCQTTTNPISTLYLSLPEMHKCVCACI